MPINTRNHGGIRTHQAQSAQRAPIPVITAIARVCRISAWCTEAHESALRGKDSGTDLAPTSVRNAGERLYELKDSTMPRLDEQLDREAVRIAALTRHLCAETGLTRVCPEVYG